MIFLMIFFLYPNDAVTAPIITTDKYILTYFNTTPPENNCCLRSGVSDSRQPEIIPDILLSADLDS